MAHNSLPFTSVFSGSGSSPAPARSHCARRRRVFIAVLLVVVLGVAALTNVGPLKAYYASRSHLAAATAQVKALETQRQQMQQELGKLSEAGYLESLARDELTYARPGEQIYVVSGAGDASTAGATGSAATSAGSNGTDKPGLLERALKAIRGMF